MESEKKIEIDNKYSRGKIYKIVCDTTGLVYIGSTIEKLSNRLSKHRADYKRYLNKKRDIITSFKVLENNNYKIILIENFPCNSKEELHREERKYIDTIECVNKVIPTRTRHEHYTDNYDKLKEYQKKYKLENNDKLLEYQKEYRLKHKDIIREYQKQYRLNKNLK